jgi:hypothetical protein
MGKRLNEEQFNRVLKVFWEDEPLETLITSEELHDFAWNYNWDDGVKDLEWIIDNTLCDKGTALLIYWHMAPVYLLKYEDISEVSEYEQEDFLFMQKLEQKYLNEGFARSNIAFDPRNDEGTNWIEENEVYRDADVQKDVPREMLEATPGIELERGAY